MPQPIPDCSADSSDACYGWFHDYSARDFDGLDHWLLACWKHCLPRTDLQWDRGFEHSFGSGHIRRLLNAYSVWVSDTGSTPIDLVKIKLRNQSLQGKNGDAIDGPKCFPRGVLDFCCHNCHSTFQVIYLCGVFQIVGIYYILWTFEWTNIASSNPFFYRSHNYPYNAKEWGTKFWWFQSS